MTPRHFKRSSGRAARGVEVPAQPAEERGLHTLEVVSGVVEGRDGRDVFIDLGPRMQGVIALDRFSREPQRGQRFEFTLRGQEEGLWVLELATTLPLVTWESMQPGQIVEARAMFADVGGLECKVGALHAFMPRAECGVPRRAPLDELIGKHFLAEVTLVDRERQRVQISRRQALQHASQSKRQEAALRLRPGSTVSGRVARFERFGAIVELDGGVSGLLHVADIDYERVAHPSERLELGQRLELVVLKLQRGGKRVGLGLKQLRPSPWKELRAQVQSGALLRGEVERVLDFGILVCVAPGVVGLCHRSQLGLRDNQHPGQAFKRGHSVVVRALEIDVERERLSLSRFYAGGSLIPTDAEALLVDAALLFSDAPSLSAALAPLLSEALAREPRASRRDSLGPPTTHARLPE